LAFVKPSRITEQRNSAKVRSLRSGLYVYPSDKSVKRFKQKIKNIFINNLNASPFKLIGFLNPIIRG